MIRNFTESQYTITITVRCESARRRSLKPLFSSLSLLHFLLSHFVIIISRLRRQEFLDVQCRVCVCIPLHENLLVG